MNHRNSCTVAGAADSTGFTKTEAGVSGLLAILVYLILWLVAMVVGLVILPSGLLVLVAILFGVSRKVRGRRLRSFFTDLFVIFGFVLLTHFLASHLELPSLPVTGALAGGLAMGVLRRRCFLPYMKRKALKYASVLAISVGIPVLVVGAASTYFSLTESIDIAVDDLRVPNVSEGWTFVEGDVQFRRTSIRYEKGRSSLTIYANRLVTPAFSDEERKRMVEFGLKARAGAADFVSEDSRLVRGKRQYIVEYRLKDGTEASTSRGYFWYCPEAGSGIYAIAEIKDVERDEYVAEIDDMLAMPICPRPDRPTFELQPRDLDDVRPGGDFFESVVPRSSRND